MYLIINEYFKNVKGINYYLITWNLYLFTKSNIKNQNKLSYIMVEL